MSDNLYNYISSHNKDKEAMSIIKDDYLKNLNHEGYEQAIYQLLCAAKSGR